MEIWDAYDEDFKMIDGVTLVRGEENTFPAGVYHLVVDVLVKHKDGTVLLMQRDKRKPYGLMWEASAGGSALKGETPLDAAFRELREETGIKAEELTEVGRVVSPENHSVYVEFVCETDCDKESVTLQEGETVDFCWVKRDILFNMGPDKLLTHRMQECLRKKSDEDMKNKDMTVPCDEGFINIRVGAILMRDGKFLMVGNNRCDYVYSVGGRIKFGETAEEAVVREVLEETGYKMDIERLGFVHENYFYGDAPSNMDKLIYEISFFYYMKVPENFEPVCGSFTDDNCEEHLRWVSPEESITVYPTFFKTELQNPVDYVKHFVTDERKR